MNAVKTDARTIFAILCKPKERRTNAIKAALQTQYPSSCRKQIKPARPATTAIRRRKSFPSGKALSSFGRVVLIASDWTRRRRLNATRKMPTKEGKSPGPGFSIVPRGSLKLAPR